MLWTVVLLSFSIILGGGTRSGFLSDVLLQIAAVPLLIISSFSLVSARTTARTLVPVAIAAGTVAIALMQIIPLPTSWGLSVVARLSHAGEDVGLAAANASLPVTTSVRSTVCAVLSGLPALAVFLSTCQLPSRDRCHLTLALLVVGVLSAFVGLLQVAQGPTSPLRFFAVTNTTEAVGFFANRNHFSALLYVLLVFCAAWSVHAVQRLRRAGIRQRFDAALLLPVLLSLTTVAILVAMQVFARSRAGLGLTIGALFGAALLSFMLPGEKGALSRRLVLAAGLLGVVLAIQFALYAILERFESDPLADARIPFARNTLAAAQVSLPLGSGLGSFVGIYGIFERPRDALLDTFANRAHNDFLEAWLEAGIPGAAVFLCFAVWYVVASIAAWRAPLDRCPAIEIALPRAASLVVLLLLAHSLVDYPLRTAALLTIFALSCGLLVPPPQEEGALGLAQHGQAWSLPPLATEAYASRVPSTIEQSRSSALNPRSPVRGRAWGEDIEWPAEWRRTGPTLEGDQQPEINPESRQDSNRSRDQ